MRRSPLFYHLFFILLNLKMFKIMKNTFEIKISGSGTPDEIIKALQDIVDGIVEAKHSDNVDAALDGATWEDEILITEISST